MIRWGMEINEAAPMIHEPQPPILMSIWPEDTEEFFRDVEDSEKIHPDTLRPYGECPFKIFVYEMGKRLPCRVRAPGSVIGEITCPDIFEVVFDRRDYDILKQFSDSKGFGWTFENSVNKNFRRSQYLWRLTEPRLYEKARPLSDFVSFRDERWVGTRYPDWLPLENVMKEEP